VGIFDFAKKIENIFKEDCLNQDFQDARIFRIISKPVGARLAIVRKFIMQQRVIWVQIKGFYIPSACIHNED
jgi:hypothetical protein